MVHYSQARPQLAKTVAARQRILEAAREVVASSGWKDAQIALIAHRAQVATGSVYRHFDSKADLYAQVLAMVSEKEAAVIAAIVDSEGSAAQRLVDAIYMFCLRALRGRRLAYALIAEPCEPEIDQARLRYRSRLADQFARVIGQGVKSGEFIAVEPALGAACVTGALMEALIEPLAKPGKQDAAVMSAVAQSIAALVARMMFKQSAPKLTLVSRGLK
jgi:AcrR family transcriptional regulator